MTPPPDGIYAIEHEPFEEDRPLVVLIHGTLDRSSSFGPVVRSLANLHVVVYDRRGYARSSNASPLARCLADHARDLAAILDGRRATLVGHSYGGDVAMMVAAEHPPLVASVGVFEPPLPWMPGWPQGSSRDPIMTAAADTDAGDIAEAFFRRLVGDKAWAILPPRTKAARRAEGPALLADFRSLSGIDAPFDPSALTMPLLVGCGAASASYQRDGARLLAANAGAELVTIAGAGHGAHVSHVDAFAGFVRRTVALGDSPSD